MILTVSHSLHPKWWEDENYIVLIEPDNVPPHLAVVSNGYWYSISIRGLRIRSAESVLRSIKEKGLTIALLQPKEPRWNELTTDDWKAAFGSHDRVDAYVTCFQPIRQVLNARAETIPELLQEWTRNQTSINVYSDQAEINIQEYTLEDVHRHIQDLLDSQHAEK